jgi:hypothetical protein
MTAMPPPWAETLLRVVLKRSDRDSVSGDLLEQYRDSIEPSHGRARANRWYVRQVVGYVWRDARVWAALFAAACIVRTAMDWFDPPVDFSARSSASTSIGVGILFLAGAWAARRSGSVMAGTVAGVATALLAAFVSIAGAALLLAVWHDPETLAAIRGSGGVGEVFTMPVAMVLPGLLLGTIGGSVGAAIARLRPS